MADSQEDRCPLLERRSLRDPRGARLATLLRAKRCSMPALAPTAMCAPVSACATDARRPKALLSRRAHRQADRNRAAVARRCRRYPRADARPAGGRSVAPQARRRRGADEARTRASRRHAAMAPCSCSAMRPIMRASASLRRKRKTCPARPVRTPSAAGLNCAGALQGASGMIVPTGARVSRTRRITPGTLRGRYRARRERNRTDDVRFENGRAKR